MKLFLIPAILPILFATSCSNCLFDRSDDCEKHYEFTIPVSIYPARDTFHIGDTIWMESSVEDLVDNNLTSEVVDISGMQLNLDLLVAEYNDTGFIISRDAFSIVNRNGSLQPYGSFFSRIIYQPQSNGKRSFKAGLIPLSKGTGHGTFDLEISYLREDYEKYGVLNKNCLDWVVFRVNTNEGKDSSNYLLLPKSFTATASQADYNRSGAYAFRVVD